MSLSERIIAAGPDEALCDWHTAGDVQSTVAGRVAEILEKHWNDPEEADHG